MKCYRLSTGGISLDLKPGLVLFEARNYASELLAMLGASHKQVAIYRVHDQGNLSYMGYIRRTDSEQARLAAQLKQPPELHK
jgi:hypothetical protein